jgi:hypothetical protein
MVLVESKWKIPRSVFSSCVWAIHHIYVAPKVDRLLWPITDTHLLLPILLTYEPTPHISQVRIQILDVSFDNKPRWIAMFRV